MRIATASLSSMLECVTTEIPHARQSQRPDSDHRYSGDRGGRARLQSLSGQERARGPADQCRSQRAEDTEQVKEADMVIAMASRFGLVALIGSFALATSAFAEQVAREQDIVN